MIILVDMDGVIADFSDSLHEKLAQNAILSGYVTKETCTSFIVEDHFPESLRAEVRAIYLKPGFFLDLPPVSGAIGALKKMVSYGHEVFICTTLLDIYDPCAPEKFKWIEKHLGFWWTKRVITTKDKTVIYGDVIIDDKPVIKGVCEKNPFWEHIVFDAPYNREVCDKRRITSWDNWEEVLFSQ